MITQNSVKPVQDIRHDPMIAGILGRVPERVAVTFSEEQLLSLKDAMGAHRGHRHPFDVRGVVGLGNRRWYYVFLAGRDRRMSRRHEGRCNRLAAALFWALFLLLGLALGLALLTVLRWGFGIDLLAGGLEQVPTLDEMLAWLPVESGSLTLGGGR